MRLYYSPRVTVICCILAALMLRASFWQYERYLEKQDYIRTMSERLKEPVVDLTPLATDPRTSWDRLIYRRVRVSGTFDFSAEMALRNRRYETTSGVFAITPLNIAGTDSHVLVSRGFIPLAHASREARAAFQNERQSSFIGLIKEGTSQRFLAPSDPPAGRDLPWVDEWLRINPGEMQKQLPYPLLPVYLEIMETQDVQAVEEQIVSSTAGRDELFFLPGKEAQLSGVKDVPNRNYPLPVFDTVIPPGRHFGYIFEWAIMAFFTLLTGVILQLRPPKTPSKSEELQ